jgi:hypothetical protein
VPKEIVMSKETTLPLEEEPAVTPAEELGLVEELKKMEYEPLLLVEKKLIAWSIGLGIISLGLLVWVSYTFFPGQH